MPILALQIGAVLAAMAPVFLLHLTVIQGEKYEANRARLPGVASRESRGYRPADAVIAVRGATIHTAAGDPIKNGTILVRAGKIVAVGANVAVPAGAKVYEMAGKDITPGLIDNHSHIGARPTDLNDSPVIIGRQHRFIDALAKGSLKRVGCKRFSFISRSCL